MKKSGNSQHKNSKWVVIKLGGSLVAPDGINLDYVRKIARRAFIFLKNDSSLRLMVIVGGGRLSRLYQQAAQKLGKIEKKDLDQLGIYATYLNAELVRQAFGGYAYASILKTRLTEQVLEAKTCKVFVGGGWRPGWSTDYVAVSWATSLKGELIVASNVDYIYNKDIGRFADAKPFKKLNWSAYQLLIPKKHSPGVHVPIDPVAVEMAVKKRLTVKFLNGNNLEAMEAALRGRSFTGTLVVPG